MTLIFKNKHQNIFTLIIFFFLSGAILELWSLMPTEIVLRAL